MYFPVLLFLQNLHKALPSTTSYYKASTKYVPVLLCVAKFAPSTASYYNRACTTYLPVLLCTTKLALSSIPLYYKVCAENTLHLFSQCEPLRKDFLTDTLFSTGRFYTEVFTHRNFYTQSKLLRKIRWELTIATFTIHDFQLHKTLVLRRQPQQRGTLMQPVQIDLLILSCKAP